MKIIPSITISAMLVAGMQIAPSAAAEAPPPDSQPAAAQAADSSQTVPVEQEPATPPAESGLRRWIPKTHVAGAFSYGYDFNDPATSTTNAQEGLYSGMDKYNAFNVDMIQLGISGGASIAGYSLKVDTGDLARVVGDSGSANRNTMYYYGGGEWEVSLQEGFLYVEPGPITLTLGRMPSPMGYEVVEPWENANITRSRAWYEQPISFDGLSAAGSAFGVDAQIGYVNTYFHDSEYDRYQQLPGFGANVKRADAESGVIYKLGTELLKTDLSVAGFWGKTDESRLLQIAGVPFLAFAQRPSEKILLNIVAARTLGPVNLAVEFNFVNLQKTGLVFYNLDDSTSTSDPNIGGGQDINGTVYLGVPIAERGSFNFRADYGTYKDDIRRKDLSQWSTTATLGWQFNDYVGVRFEYRYDGAGNIGNNSIVPFQDGNKRVDSAHTLQLQMTLSASPT